MISQVWVFEQKTASLVPPDAQWSSSCSCSSPNTSPANIWFEVRWVGWPNTVKYLFPIRHGSCTLVCITMHHPHQQNNHLSGITRYDCLLNPFRARSPFDRLPLPFTMLRRSLADELESQACCHEWKRYKNTPSLGHQLTCLFAVIVLYHSLHGFDRLRRTQGGEGSACCRAPRSTKWGNRC